MIECAVKGMINPGAMCGAVIVGNKSCGFDGECEHQRKPDQSGDATEKVGELCPRPHNRPEGTTKAECVKACECRCTAWVDTIDTPAKPVEETPKLRHVGTRAASFGD